MVVTIGTKVLKERSTILEMKIADLWLLLSCRFLPKILNGLNPKTEKFTSYRVFTFLIDWLTQIGTNLN
jgi:hypothetical protein